MFHDLNFLLFLLTADNTIARFRNNYVLLTYVPIKVGYYISEALREASVGALSRSKVINSLNKKIAITLRLLKPCLYIYVTQHAKESVGIKPFS